MIKMEFEKGEVLREEEYGALYCSRCKKRVKVLYLYFDRYLCIDCINEIEKGEEYEEV